MRLSDANEAAPIVDRTLANLALTLPAQGRAGSDARTAIGDTRANAYTLCVYDRLGPELTNCFTLAQQAGTSFDEIDYVRQKLELETPQTLGAKLVQNASILICLSIESSIIAGMDFISRQDVETIKSQIFQPFQQAEETAADDMDQMTFQALIALHGAVTNHLVVTARPLPLMMNFQFFEPLPSLVMAYKLYADASRCDQLVEENKVVHPAFCPPLGQALSS